MAAPIDKNKCETAYEEILDSLRSENGDGYDAVDDKYWADTRKDLVGPEYRLSQAEAQTVIAGLKRELGGSETVTAKAPIQTDTPEIGDGADWIESPDWPGYAIDTHCRLTAVSGVGRKVGKIISLTRVWHNKAGKGKAPKWQFRMYYQITVAGQAKKIPYYDVGIARNRLEGQRRYPKD